MPIITSKFPCQTGGEPTKETDLKQDKIHMIFYKMLRGTLRPWSVLLQLWSLLFSKRSITNMFCFIFNTFFPSLKHSVWFTKRSVSFSKRFVLYKLSNRFLQKVPSKVLWVHSNVIRKFHGHYQNGELTQKSKANSNYLENNSFIVYIRTFSIKLHWPTS